MKRVILTLAVLVLGIATTTHATLFNRGTDSLGNRLIYDDDLNITWYDYTNPSDTWQNQVNWATALDVHFGGIHYTDWRLPVTVDGVYSWGYSGATTAGLRITSSEMGHMYYAELENKGYTIDGVYPQPGWGLVNTRPFQHLQPDYYCSGTEYSLNANDAWTFNFYDGTQHVDYEGNYFYALAVRSGDVQAAPVPEPGTWLLLGMGLGGIIAASRCFAPCRVPAP